MSDKPEKQNSDTKTEGLKGLLETIAPLLSFFFDDELKESFEKDPDLEKLAYARAYGLSGEYEKEKARIDTEQLLEEMSAREKSTLLLTQFFGDFFEDRNPLFTFTKVDDAKEKYRTLAQDPAAFALKEFDGVPHMLVPTNLFKPDPKFLRNEHPSFPIPLESRLVMGVSLAPFAFSVMKAEAEAQGKKLTVFTPKEKVTTPRANEVQLVLAPDLGQFEDGEIDWTQVEFYSALWDDEVPAFGFTPDLLAAVFVKQGLSPAEACSKAGLENPSEKFLEALAKTPSSESAPTEPTSTEPDTSDEDPDAVL